MVPSLSVASTTSSNAQTSTSMSFAAASASNSAFVALISSYLARMLALISCTWLNRGAKKPSGASLAWS